MTYTNTAKEQLNVNELIKDLDTGELGCEFENYSGSSYICDALSEIADNNVSIYYSDIKKFVANNVEYFEEAINEFGWDGCGSDFHKAGQMAQYIKNQEDLYKHLDDSILNYAYKYYVDITDSVLIDDELNDLLVDYCSDVDHDDYLSAVTDIIDDYLKEEE